jgi:hypothetical protein
VVQQLRSFTDLHAAELEALAAELEPEVGAKLLTIREMQRDEIQLVVDEVGDILAQLSEAEVTQAEGEAEAPPEEQWKTSPKRAAWLAAQRAPRTRRELFRKGQ